MTRQICPKNWKYAKIIYSNGSILYKKVRKLNKYSYGIYLSEKIKDNNFRIEKLKDRRFPFKFSVKLTKETEHYYYVTIPSEITEILSLKNKEVMKYSLGNETYIGRLKKKCNSFILNISRVETNKWNLSYDNLITFSKKISFKSPKEKIIIKRGNNKKYFDLSNLLPKYTSRDNLPFRIYYLNKNKILVSCEFKHVKGEDFKYIILPRFLEVNKLALFFGLMHSDGFKKFGYYEIYKKKINSPYVGFTNGEPQIIDLFLNLFESLFEIKRDAFIANLRYPLELKEKQRFKLEDFWRKLVLSTPKIYLDKKRESKWCPAGIINIGIYNILFAEIIISSLKRFLKNIENANKNVKESFLKGVLIGDGSPILDKNKIRRIMIAIEFKEEGDMYTSIFNSLKYKARNLFINGNPHRLVDISGGIKSIEHFIKRLNFGFWDGKKYYGSLEKHYKLLKGYKNCSQSKKNYYKEKDALELLLKIYINELSTFLTIPKYYREIFQ